MSVVAETHSVEWSVDGRVFQFSMSSHSGELFTPEGQIIALSSIEWQTLARVLTGQVPSFATPKQGRSKQARGAHVTLGNGENRDPNQGERWTADLDKRLADRWRAGTGIPILMNEFGRNRGGIVSRLTKLGLMLNPNPDAEIQQLTALA